MNFQSIFTNGVAIVVKSDNHFTCSRTRQFIDCDGLSRAGHERHIKFVGIDCHPTRSRTWIGFTSDTNIDGIFTVRITGACSRNLLPFKFEANRTIWISGRCRRRPRISDWNIGMTNIAIHRKAIGWDRRVKTLKQTSVLLIESKITVGQRNQGESTIARHCGIPRIGIL